MLDAGVITEVHEAPPWINSFVIVETVKDGKRKLRICLDPKPLNKAIMHELYITHTPAKYITVTEFKKSFWQFVLDEESSYLTTFNTPFGCYHNLWMPFGTNVSEDCYQHGIDSMIKIVNHIGATTGPQGKHLKYPITKHLKGPYKHHIVVRVDTGVDTFS